MLTKVVVVKRAYTGLDLILSTLSMMSATDAYPSRNKRKNVSVCKNATSQVRKKFSKKHTK